MANIAEQFNPFALRKKVAINPGVMGCHLWKGSTTYMSEYKCISVTRFIFGEKMNG